MRNRCCALLSIVAFGCSGGLAPDGQGTFPATPYETVKSEDGALIIEVRTAPVQPPQRGPIEVELTVTDATSGSMPRDGLDLTVVPWMPEMGHGASTKPVVAPKGNGQYALSNISLFMPGRWELRTSISDSADHRATIPLQIP